MSTFTFMSFKTKKEISIFTKIVFAVLIVFTIPIHSADIFEETEEKALSLDERIKALESSISIKSNTFTTDNKQNSDTQAEQNRRNFQKSISGQLDASTLENEVQQLKSELIELNKELAILEEEILTPVSSQAALFLSIDKGHFFNLDGLKVEIDGNVVSHHLYTKQEIDALKKGAIQRVHTANLAPGNHEIVVILSGYSIDGRDVKQAASYKFYKPNSKKYIELAIVDNTEKQKVEFNFSEWQ